MFPPNYFPPRYFAPRYWPPSGVIAVIGGFITFTALRVKAKIEASLKVI